MLSCTIIAISLFLLSFTIFIKNKIITILFSLLILSLLIYVQVIDGIEFNLLNVNYFFMIPALIFTSVFVCYKVIIIKRRKAEYQFNGIENIYAPIAEEILLTMLLLFNISSMDSILIIPMIISSSVLFANLHKFTNTNYKMIDLINWFTLSLSTKIAFFSLNVSLSIMIHLIFNNLQSFKDENNITLFNGETLKNNVVIEKKNYLITGENGSGKSTFILRYFNKSNYTSNIEYSSSLFQQSIEIDFSLKEYLYILNNKKDIDYILEELDFKRLMNVKFNKLSSGQKQLFKFIITLSYDVDFYIFDEIENNLDDENTIKVFSIIKEYIEKENKNVIFISHRQKINIDLTKLLINNGEVNYV